MIYGACESDPGLHPELQDAPLDQAALRSIPYQDQPRPRLLGEEDCKRLNKILHSVPGLEAAGEDDGRFLRLASCPAGGVPGRSEQVRVHGVGKEMYPL